MAEYLFKALSPKNWPIQVFSFGTMTVDGQKPSDLALVIAMQEGIDLSPHLSRAFHPEQVRTADLILSMSLSQKLMLQYAMPDLSDRIFCLTEFGRSGKKCTDIKDPMGGDASVYQKCFSQIQKEIERIIPAVGNYFRIT
jgi:protein-tyrosine phosphatase